MSDAPEQFDPAFRSAVQRAAGKLPAPAPLREKIAAILSASATAGSLPAAKRRWALPDLSQVTPRVAALAAVVLLALGWAAMQIRDFVGDAQQTGPAIVRPPMSATLAASMVRTHDDCAQRADHHRIPGNDLKALQPQLAGDAGINAFSAPLGDGWQFRGAGVYSIGSVKAAELFFTRGEQNASVFSMRTDDDGCAQGECMTQIVNHRALAAVSKGGSLYVVVVSQNGGGDPLSAVAQGMLKTVELSVFGSTIGCSGAAPATPPSPSAPPAAVQH